MQFRVVHETRYRYDHPVTLGRHVLRLSPRQGAARLGFHRIEVTPTPLSRRESCDAFGNTVVEVDFEGRSQLLEIRSEFELETQPLAEPPARRLSALPWSDNAPELFAYRAQTAAGQGVRAFAESLAAETRRDPLAFLNRLTRELYGFDRQIRPTGDANTAEETLSSRRGACRDLAMLFLETCRCLGIAGRFVSGYQAEAESLDGRRYLHAWPEVFVPGVGFRGWDPTHGLRVGEGHVALCAAPTQAGTMPVEGSFSFDGPAVTSTLDFDVHIATR